VSEVNEETSLERVGRLCGEICESYRLLAICRLLRDADSDGFCHELVRSARTRIYFLERCRQANDWTSDFALASRSGPFFDALAAGQMALARDMATLSPKEWRSDDEYEDDFLYAHFFHRLTSATSRVEVAPELTAILDRLEAVLDDDPSARLELGRALVSAPENFGSAFARLLEDRGRQLESEQEGARGEEIGFPLERSVFIEGIAILRWADHTGLATQAEHPYCPGLARLAMKKPFPGGGIPGSSSGRR
jgi:hypothetical protein